MYKISGVSGKMTTETASEDDNFGTEASSTIITKVNIYFIYSYSFVHPFVRLFVYLLIRSFVPSFLRSFVRSFIHSFVYSSFLLFFIC